MYACGTAGVRTWHPRAAAPTPWPALEAHIRDAALKHYGDWRKLEARYDPEKDRVEVFQDVLVVERRTASPL